MSTTTRCNSLIFALFCLLHQITVVAACDGTCVGIVIGGLIAAILLIAIIVVLIYYKKCGKHDINTSNVGYPGMKPNSKDIEEAAGYDNKAYTINGDWMSYLTPVVSVPGYVACREYKPE